MPNWLRNTLRTAGILAGCLAIFLVLSSIITAARQSAQNVNDASVGSAIQSSYISASPFGPEDLELNRGDQYFYNMVIKKQDGVTCYVTASFRWILHYDGGSVVFWNDNNGGETAGMSKSSGKIAQAFSVPAKLLPGEYTLTRLAVYRCGDDANYARVVRTTEVRVK